ncbi:MAG: D-alanyl-D-alanine carboxypeptidase [Oscillospiraceae bacterium]|nr:D-alanyl-D-alanine carboxypeptidase [Oscillospiraceae bacterium]
MTKSCRGRAAAVCLTVVFVLILCPFAANATDLSPAKSEEKPSGKALPAPEILSPYGVVLDARTGAVIFEKNPHEKRPMASTTKLMTAILALETEDIGREVTVTNDMVVGNNDPSSVKLNLQPNDRITMHDLITAMMMLSANDAAQSIAIDMAGSFDAFASRMNERAAELGMFNTHFVTPSGLHDPDHFSTAYDMALLGIEAAKNPEMIYFTSATKRSIFFGSPTQNELVVTTRNDILPYRRFSKKEDKWTCDGLKTGYTGEAGYCFVSHTLRDDISLVCVTLDARSANEYFKDHRALYECAYSHYINKGLTPTIEQPSIPVLGGAKPDASVYVDGSGSVGVFDSQEGEISKRVELAAYVEAPVSKRQVVGHVRYYYGNALLIEFPIRSGDNIDRADTNWVSAYAAMLGKV